MLRKKIAKPESELLSSRIIFIIVTIVGISAGFAYKLIVPWDSLLARVLCFSVLPIGLIISFFGDNEKKLKTIHTTWIVFSFISLLWLAYGFYMNKLDLAWLIGMMGFMSLVSQVIGSSVLLFSLFIFGIITALVATYLAQDPVTNKIFVAFIITFLNVIFYILGENKIRLNKSLVKSEKAMNDIFENSTDALILMTSDTLNILDCNRIALEMLGYGDKNDVIGVEKDSIFSDGFTKEDWDNILHEHDQSGKWSKVLQLTTKTGKQFWVDVVVKPIEVDNEKVLLMRISDITKIKDTQKKLDDSVKQLTGQKEELEKMNKTMVGRELKMVELKKELDSLKSRLASPTV